VLRVKQNKNKNKKHFSILKLTSKVREILMELSLVLIYAIVWDVA